MNAILGRGRGLLRVARVRLAAGDGEALLLRQLPALRRLVHDRVVELVQLVLRRLDELHRCGTFRLGLQERRVLLLARLRRLSDRPAQSSRINFEAKR